MCGFRSLNNSTSKRVLNMLEPVKLTVWRVMIERESYSNQVNGILSTTVLESVGSVVLSCMKIRYVTNAML